MRIENERESENVEDRRGMGKGTVIGGGIGAVILAVVIALMGGDPSALLNQGGPAVEQNIPNTPEANAAKLFVSKVLASTEDVWARILPQQANIPYENPRLVLFSGLVESACGRASASTGPFYCPGDRQVYIDLSFFEELASRFGAPGDFAQAYVIAHEVGHHVQKLTGASDMVARKHGTPQFNQLSVRLELQADFYAGVWAYHADKMRSILEAGDIEEGLTAANAIGDDRLQKQSGGQVMPDSFTHGTSAQRIRWFKKGYTTGDMRQGDTFSVPYERL
ncbi:MAG TPA: neutral zinc metallopeptidase [Verrucomicrobiales bacterium]|jgi:predicted metalloprotease|nr:neutral zinc metallopeptidase [Verrucomicrobiales bacterium]